VELAERFDLDFEAFTLAHSGLMSFESDVEPLSPDFSWAAASIGGACLIGEASRSFL